jgi:hypothetical protein
MLSYQQTAAPANLWPEPVEQVWQMQPGVWRETNPRWKRQDITLSDRAFIGAVVNLPRELRPWGSVTWLSSVYRTSRETIYTIGAQVRRALLFSGQEAGRQDQPLLLPTPYPPEWSLVTVSDNRLKRTILTFLLPGGVTLRPMQDCLDVALDVTRSVGFLSQFINEDGRRAGEILDQIDYSPLGDIILARDETYFDDLAFLIGVEPRTYVLLAGQVEEGCDGETWGLSLAFDQTREGLRIVELAEDGALFYPRSQREAAALLEAEFSVPVQKDVWHAEDKAAQTVTDMERIALSKLQKAYEMEQKLAALDTWNEDAFSAWVEVEEKAERLVEMSGQVRFWCSCLCDALEVVDWRSGEIRDREINAWLLGETIQGLQKLDHPRVKKLVTYIRNQQGELLTFLDRLEIQIAPWRRKLARVLPDAQEQVFFERTVARAWRLSRALINGHRRFRSEAQFALDLVAELIAGDQVLHGLAEELLNTLENVVRTSCAAETVNSVLKPYLRVKRSFQSRETAQNWFNLFRLWFCMHPFKRSHKRQGQSPFQLAGIKVYTPDGRETDDWLEALGYPADV